MAMKAQKVTVEISVEVLSTDSVPAMLRALACDYEQDRLTGGFSHEDGDQINWSTEFEEVNI